MYFVIKIVYLYISIDKIYNNLYLHTLIIMVIPIGVGIYHLIENMSYEVLYISQRLKYIVYYNIAS